MAADYERGRRDGLRLALAILSAEEEKWAPLLGESRSWRTNRDREVRHKALQVAQTRLQTALSSSLPSIARNPMPSSPPRSPRSGCNGELLHASSQACVCPDRPGQLAGRLLVLS